MKSFYKYFFLAVFILGAISCSEDDSDIDPNDAPNKKFLGNYRVYGLAGTDTIDYLFHIHALDTHRAIQIHNLLNMDYEIGGVVVGDFDLSVNDEQISGDTAKTFLVDASLDGDALSVSGKWIHAVSRDTTLYDTVKVYDPVLMDSVDVPVDTTYTVIDSVSTAFIFSATKEKEK